MIQGPTDRSLATKEDTIPAQATEEATLTEELEVTREVEYIEFELGDHVVYPHHGAGKVLKKEEMEILGERREYLTIKILHNDMTVRVPTENAALAGLRRVIDEETVKKVLDVLRDEVSEMPKNWNRRFKHNRDKIKTGDIYELAEVVRNLSLRESEKGLSTGEKQMFTRTKKILASELMYALDKDEEEAESYLDELLADSASCSAGGRRSEVARLSRTRRHPVPRARAPHTMSVALIVAAGSGERLGAGRPEGARRARRALAACAWSIDALAQSARHRADRDRAAARPALARRRRTRGGACAAGAPRSWRRGRRHALGVCAQSARRRSARDDPVLVHDAARALLTPGSPKR